MAATLLITAVCSCVFLASTSQNRIMRNAASVSDYAHQINAWLEKESQRVSNVAEEIGYQNYDTTARDSLYPYLVDCIERMPEMFAIYVCPDNYSSFSDGWIPDADYTIVDRQWYQDAAASDGAVIIEPYIDALTGEMVITIAKAFRRDGSVSCVVAADMFLTGAQEIVAGFSSDESGYPILTSSGGNIIIHSDSSLMPWVDDQGNEHFTEYSSTVRNVSGSTTDNGTTASTLTDYDGVARCEISADIPAAGWKFSYAMNSSELTRDVTNIIIIFGVLIPVIITAAAIVCTIVVKRCFRPLAAVSAAAQRMTHGLSVKFDYMADDEIGSVCRIIEQTNDTLHSCIADISAHLDEMSRGDFTNFVTLEYAGDLAPIKTSLNHIISELGNVFSAISEASGAVFSGAENVSNGASDLAETSSKQTALVDEISTDVNSADEIISNNVSLTGNARQLSDNTSAANAEESAAAAAELDSQAARLREMTEKFKVRPNPPCQRYGGYFYMPGAEYLELPKAEGLRPPLFLICLSDYSSMDFSSVSRSVKAPTRSLRVCA